MKLLFHMCCAPCSTYPVEELRKEGHQLHGMFFNPNIHPYKEYKKRLDTVIQYADSVDLPLTVIDEYNIEEFLRNFIYHEKERCQICYKIRLNKAAQIAKEGNFDGFTSSLLVSPYQKHELIKRTAQDIGKQQGIEFIYRDFRPGFRKGQEIAKEMELYRQPYCGCIYSEAERYQKK